MGALAVLGLNPLEEQVYEALARVVSSSAGELAASSAASAEAVADAVRSLTARGLVVPLVGEGDRIAAAPHEAALDALVHQHQQALALVQVHGQHLAGLSRRAALLRTPGDLVAVVVGSDQIEAQFEQLQRMATREIMVFDRPPYRITGGTAPNPHVAERTATGVTYRTVYDRSLLDNPDTLARIRRELAAGEQGRILEGLPLKLAIADRSMAILLLLNEDETNDQAALVIRPSVLLDSLATLFDALWERATPLVGPDATDAGSIEPDLREVVELLAAGLADDTIARYLGLSERTVRRRVAAALDALGAKSRFQGGARAQQLGWLAP